MKSNIKFIDIWFLWHVVCVFVIIVCHIVINRIRKRLESQQNEIKDYVEDCDWKISKTKKVENINKALCKMYSWYGDGSVDPHVESLTRPFNF